MSTFGNVHTEIAASFDAAVWEKVPHGQVATARAIVKQGEEYIRAAEDVMLSDEALERRYNSAAAEAFGFGADTAQNMRERAWARLSQPIINERRVQEDACAEIEANQN